MSHQTSNNYFNISLLLGIKLPYSKNDYPFYKAHIQKDHFLSVQSSLKRSIFEMLVEVVQDMSEVMIDNHESQIQINYTTMLDGWSGCLKKITFLNFLISSIKISMFLKSIDTSISTSIYHSMNISIYYKINKSDITQ